MLGTTGRSGQRGRTRRRRLDGSLRTLAVQLLLASGGLFGAFAVASVLGELVLGAGSGLRATIVRALAWVGPALGFLYLTSARPLRRELLAQHERVRRTEERLRLELDRHRFASELAEALELRHDEDSVAAVVGLALGRVHDGPAELLLADSSRAHVHRAATGPAGPAGCSVSSPEDCPAVRRGHQMTFHEDDLDACPHLAADPESPFASCHPLAALGSSVGVVHVRSRRAPVPADRLETLAHQAGARLGILRALASRELAAATDPLTGAVNRRTLDAELARAADAGAPFCVVFADLDHFKELNDTFGHAAGDRALRTFVHHLRAQCRPGDVVCRYGGEEFVVLLPGADRVRGVELAEAVRASLGRTGRVGDGPPLTASFGVADTAGGGDPAAVVRAADQAMFVAKRTGRDRVSVAGDPVSDVVVDLRTHRPRVVRG